MKFVVDTNILFTFFWKYSFTKGLLVDKDLEYFAPVYALEEINKYRDEILKRTGISLGNFKELRRNLAIFVEFISLEEYKEFMLEALSLIPMYQNDIDFLALALKLRLPIWSNDSHLKKQSKIKVYTTLEFIKQLGLKQ